MPQNEQEQVDELSSIADREQSSATDTNAPDSANSNTLQATKEEAGSIVVHTMPKEFLGAKEKKMQTGENQGTFSIDNLKKFASGLGLNTTKFNSCLDSQKYNAQIQADIAEANRNGFQSTPSTAIGQTPIIGAQPYTQFKAVIDAELAK